MDIKFPKYIVVGAGFFGAVLAERIAEVLGDPVLVIDRRKHIGGNAYSERESTSGIEVHKYGSHIFHTNDERVIKYLKRFTDFYPYQHKVFATVQDRVFSLPVNLMTINAFFRTKFNPAEAKAFLETLIRIPSGSSAMSFEEKAISTVGQELYESFFKGYSEKHWGVSCKELPAQVFSRLPVRWDYNDRYFNDSFEGIPIDGYGAIFRKLLKHPKIEVSLGVDFREIRGSIGPNTKIIYSGPIDQYFDYKFGDLGWRTCDFEQTVLETPDYQGCAVMNYPDKDIKYTRIHEYKHYLPIGQRTASATVIHKEFPRAALRSDVPFYPTNTPGDRALFAKYKELASQEQNLIIGGRLGSYVYIDMHQAIAMALNTFESKILRMNAA